MPDRIAEALQPLAVPIDSIHPDPANVRRHPEANLTAIKASLAAYGQRKPVVANRRTGTIEAGNGTWEAAKALGWDSIAVVQVDDDPLTATGFAIADNRTAELAEWDEDGLSRLLKELKTADALGNTGFSDDDLGDLLDRLEKQSLLDALDSGESTDDDAVPDEAPALTQPGEIIQLGPHRLLCGDSTNPDDVAKLFAGAPGHLEFLCCDPPYGIGFNPEDVERIKKWRGDGARNILISADWAVESTQDYDGFFGRFVDAFTPVLPSDRGCTVMVFNSYQQIGCMERHFTRAGLKWMNLFVWCKSNAPLSFPGKLVCSHEPAAIFYKQGSRHFCGEDIMRDYIETAATGRDERAEGEFHPSPKPVALIERLVRKFAPRGGIVADLFLGSGTTLIACENSGRVCYAIERDPKYCDIIRERYRRHVEKRGGKAVAIPGQPEASQSLQ